LIGVAANKGTIESVCAEMADAPDGETIRAYLNEQLKVEDLPQLERRLNQALAGQLAEEVAAWWPGRSGDRFSRSL
jgi:hypothetical protein